MDVFLDFFWTNGHLQLDCNCSGLDFFAPFQSYVAKLGGAGVGKGLFFNYRCISIIRPSPKRLGCIYLEELGNLL